MTTLPDKNRRAVLCAGIRTPFVKAGTTLRQVRSEDLGATLVRELLDAYPKIKDQVDEVIIGCVGQDSVAPNVARVISVKSDLPLKVPAYTVARNCASGLESITQAMNQVWLGRSSLTIVGGVESMSNYPLRYPISMNEKLEGLARAKKPVDKLKAVSQIRFKDVKPVITVLEGLTDPLVDMIMGQTAELLARENNITRDEQDAFSQRSHQKATEAWEKGFFADEVRPVVNSVTGQTADKDNGIRPDSSIEKLKKLRPFFEPIGGTVTVGNSSQVTDGAAMCIVTSQAKAEALGLPIMAILHDYAFAGCDPKRMGLGPVYATQKLMDQNKFTWKDIDVVELNEAFAAQVLACVKLMEKDRATYGMFDPEQLNPNGGAIAMGHPVGATGTRLTLTAARYLQKNKLKNAVATLCIGGGQGGAIRIESVS
jgi:acetyl-CoA acetyltransferase family protein